MYITKKHHQKDTHIDKERQGHRLSANAMSVQSKRCLQRPEVESEQLFSYIMVLIVVNRVDVHLHTKVPT